MMVYIPSDPWKICDICGFKFRQSDTIKDWQGLIVCKTCWEPKHPQLNVKTIREHIAVKDPRPRPADRYKYTEGETTLAENAGAGSQYIMLDSVSGISAGDYIGVTLNNGNIIWTTVSTVSASTELVTNGTQEVSTGWTDYGGSTASEQSSEQAYAGTNSRKITLDGSGTSGGIRQSITGLTVGNTYRARALFRGSTLAAQYFYLYFGADVDYRLWSNGGWVLLDGYWTATATSTTVRTYVYNTHVANAGAVFYVDNISVKGVVVLTDALLGSADEDNVVYYASALNEITSTDL